jgi:CcmD family protein
MTYLYAAYAATWIIHILYLASIARRYKRIQREVDEIHKRD